MVERDQMDHQPGISLPPHDSCENQSGTDMFVWGIRTNRCRYEHPKTFEDQEVFPPGPCPQAQKAPTIRTHLEPDGRPAASLWEYEFQKG